MEDNTFLERRDAFLAEYGALTLKHMCDFISTPQFVMNEKGSWDLIIVPDIADKTEHPVKSPFTM